MIKFRLHCVFLCMLFGASSVQANTLQSSIDTWFTPFSQAFSDIVFFKIEIFGQAVPLIVMWLGIAAVFFTVYLGFINIRAFPYALKLIKGDYSKAEHSGEISHFQALATAVSGTVGIGNIGGVAVAIGIGGPGAAFWLIVAGFLSMSTKLVECTLGVKYRYIGPDGTVSGGPMYYLEAFFENKQLPRIGKAMGGFYALSLLIGCLGIGNMFQSNQAYIQFIGITGGEESYLADKGWLFGIVLALIVGLVILGGIRSIAKVAEKLVPFMALLYIISAIIVIAMSSEHLPLAIQQMVSGAFTADGATGGAIGALIVGFQRALFSNEAGLGSASIAHSAVKTDAPASEGVVSVLEPFIDTVVICTLTSLVIITTAYPNGIEQSGLEGIALTSATFAHHFAWAPYPLAVAALLFAFSTTVSWSYYGLQGWAYLVGNEARAQLLFKVIFCSFLVLGCMTNLTSILNFSDAIVFLISIPNIVGLYLFAPEVKREVNGYLDKLKGTK